MEDKIKYIIPIIILSLFLLGCKADEEETSTTTALEGTWKTACYINTDDNTSFIFSYIV